MFKSRVYSIQCAVLLLALKAFSNMLNTEETKPFLTLPQVRQDIDPFDNYTNVYSVLISRTGNPTISLVRCP